MIQFLNRVDYPKSNIDVFFNRFEDLVRFSDYLTNCADYVYNQGDNLDYSLTWTAMQARLALDTYKDEVDYSELDSVNEVVTLERCSRKRKIELTFCSRPLPKIVIGFDTTLVINFITSNAAYSLFPLLIFRDRRGMLLKKEGKVWPAQKERYTKYKRHGFYLEMKIAKTSRY